MKAVIDYLFECFERFDNVDEKVFNTIKNIHPNRFENIIKRIDDIDFDKFCNIFHLRKGDNKYDQFLDYFEEDSYITMLNYVFNIWKDGEFTKQIFDEAKKLYIETNQKYIDFLNNLTYNDYKNFKEK